MIRITTQTTTTPHTKSALTPTALNLVCRLYGEVAPTVEMLDLLLRHGTDVHGGKGCETTLHTCVRYHKHPATVARFLLRRGADPNRVCRAGFPPLHKLMFGRINYEGFKTDIVETVKVLLEAGTNVNAVNAFGDSVVDIVNAKLAQAKKEKIVPGTCGQDHTPAVEIWSAILRILEDMGGRSPGM
jgi:hypothetical protein